MYCEINIDDCENHQCQNEGACLDGVNGYTCDCPEPFIGKNKQEIGSYTEFLQGKMQGDITYCEINIDGCEHHQCQNGGACVDGVTGYTCDCPEPFVRKDKQEMEVLLIANQDLSLESPTPTEEVDTGQAEGWSTKIYSGWISPYNILREKKTRKEK